ncbi:hypothetical protein WJX73_005062 [Symbiochloris irregularis]|uniref:Uncharacterized protein n=1 Tax=Symbiochloris irregularis TaxID=706552 RepID=A0AAW1PN72_9CHLO
MSATDEQPALILVASSAEEPEWVAACRDWCLEQGFEYIKVSAGAPAVDERLSDRDGEQQGVRRVLSALQAHMWPGLQMKHDQPQPRYATADDSETATPAMANGPTIPLPEPSDLDRPEDDLERFERLLAQASEARDSLRDLPDDQRRAQAARLAQHFASMLGVEDSDSDD